MLASPVSEMNVGGVSDMDEHARPRILVVDDTPSNITLLVHALESTFDLRVAHNGENALAAVEEETPDLILLDINMPGMDGHEVCRRLKALPATHDTPVIFLTSLDDEENELKGLEIGAVDYLTRPISTTILLARIHSHLELKKSRDMLALALTETQSAKEEAERATQSKSEFLAITSHEIRTPLGAIVALCELLEKTHLNKVQHSYASTIRHSGEALLTILNDILDFSKIEAGKLELDAGPFKIREVVEEVCLALAGKAHQKSLEILSVVAPDLPEVLIGDASRLRQMLYNLIGNAVKFTQHGHVLCRLSTQATEGPTLLLKVEVVDTGIGIPARTLSRLFQAYAQADKGTSSRFGGTGLGLNITRHLAELMGGCVGVESEEGKGSTFWFTVNLETTAHEATPSHPLEHIRILALTGNPSMAEALEGRFPTWGANFQSFAEERGLLTAWRRDPESLVIIDCTSCESARAVLFRLRAETRGAHPVLLLLPVSESRVPQSWGCQTLIASKPFCDDELLRQTLELTNRGSSSAERKDPSASMGHSYESWPGRQVLIVDDNPANQLLARGILAQHGIEVTSVSTGEAALELLLENSFDAVLLDWNMPGISGAETATRIRERGGTRQALLPLIAFTAIDWSELKEEVSSVYLDGHVSKPLREADLFQVLDRLWQGTTPVRLQTEATEQAQVNAHLMRLVGAMGNLAMVEEFVRELLEQTMRGFQDLDAALGRGDFKELVRFAHDLKSNLGHVGASHTAELLTSLMEEAHAAQVHGVAPTERLRTVASASLNSWSALLPVLEAFGGPDSMEARQ